MGKINKIAVMTSGGDSPGMNAAIIQPDTTVNIETLDDGSTNVIRITQK